MSKILVIEDEEPLRVTLCEILEIHGYNVLQAENGQQGIDLFNKIRPDLIICDINMPIIDGFEVLTLLKKNGGISQVPPFIFLSAKVEPENKRRAINEGALDFISKPYSASYLLSVIERGIKSGNN